MIGTEFSDFGKLYKAAFAERQPKRKLFLLKQVQKAIENWEEDHAPPTKVATREKMFIQIA